MAKLEENKLKHQLENGLLTGITLLFLFGCGHTAYMGMHGKSIKLSPGVHEHINYIEDSQCLKCHDPDNPEGPACPHPKFKGCIKCHND